MNSSFETTNSNTVEVLGVKDVKNKFSIYPNPASNNITIEFEREEFQVIYVFNIVGNFIYQKSINDKNLEIDTSNWSKGIYLIKTIDTVKKLIIK